jgi:hypothetical protein
MDMNISQLVTRLQKLESVSLPWKNIWREILEAVEPYEVVAEPLWAGGSSGTSSYRYHSALGGLVRNMATSLGGQLFSPDSDWFSLEMNQHMKRSLGNASQQKLIQGWFNSCEETCNEIFLDSESNFYPVSYQLVKDWYFCGTSVLYVEWFGGRKFKFSAINPLNVVIERDAHEEIVFVGRKYTLSGRQALRQYGEAMQLTSVDEDRPYEFWHVIEKNYELVNELDPHRWISRTVDYTSKRVLEESYLGHNPYILSCFYRNSGELLGRSPLWYSLKEIKYLDALSVITKESVEYNVRPPILSASALALGKVKLAPGVGIAGGISSSGKPLVTPLSLGANFQLSDAWYDKKLGQLESALVMQALLPIDKTRLNEAEIGQRVMESDWKIRPVLVTWEHECLNPLVKLILECLVNEPVTKQGDKVIQFPYVELGMREVEFPDPLAGLQVKYSGPLNKLRRKYELLQLQVMLQQAAQIGQMEAQSIGSTDVFYSVDFGEAFRKIGELYDPKEDILRTREEVLELRQKAEDAAQAARAEEQAGLRVERDLKIQALKERQGELG